MIEVVAPKKFCFHLRGIISPPIQKKRKTLILVLDRIVTKATSIKE